MILGIFLVSIFLVSKGDGQNYCETNKNHILCDPASQTNFDVINCRKYMKRFLLSKEDENSILSTINFYREKVAKGKIPKGYGYSTASPSANMMRAKWDDELAYVANQISNLCQPYKPCDGCIDLERFPSTFVQNYVISNNEKFTPNDWKSYIDQIILNKETSSLGPSKTSLDLITWAENYLVGCGLSIFSFEGKIIHNFVCAFGPILPDDNEKPSVAGLPCSYCPLGSECVSDDDVLCDCESLCFPFKYKILSRMRRQGNNDTQNGASGNDSKEEPTITDDNNDKETTGDETEASEDTGEPAAGTGVTEEPVIDMTTDGGGVDPVVSEEETEVLPSSEPTKASIAVHPLSIGFIIHLFYSLCVTKILK